MFYVLEKPNDVMFDSTKKNNQNPIFLFMSLFSETTP